MKEAPKLTSTFNFYSNTTSSSFIFCVQTWFWFFSVNIKGGIDVNRFIDIELFQVLCLVNSSNKAVGMITHAWGWLCSLMFEELLNLNLNKKYCWCPPDKFIKSLSYFAEIMAVMLPWSLQNMRVIWNMSDQIPEFQTTSFVLTLVINV